MQRMLAILVFVVSFAVYGIDGESLQMEHVSYIIWLSPLKNITQL